jgi:type I restriction-modification system DNA methylase subunit
MDAAEYRHAVFGLIFFKYISDSFEEHFSHLKQEVNDPQSQWSVSGPEQQYLPQILREKGISREK